MMTIAIIVIALLTILVATDPDRPNDGPRR